jgi:hypothetical protein
VVNAPEKYKRQAYTLILDTIKGLGRRTRNTYFRYGSFVFSFAGLYEGFYDCAGSSYNIRSKEKVSQYKY